MRDREREDEEEEVKVNGKERKRRKKESGKTRGGEIAGDDDRPGKLRVSERKTSPRRADKYRKRGRSREG